MSLPPLPWLPPKGELPPIVEARIAMAYETALLGHPQAALPLLQAIAPLAQNHPVLEAAAGVIQQMGGNLKAASDHYGTALSLRPDVPELHFNIGLCAAREIANLAGKERNLDMLAVCDSGQQHLAKAIDLNLGRPEAYLLLGSLRIIGYLYAEAIPPLETFTTLHPEFSSAWRSLGDAYEGAGAIDQAVSAYRRSFEGDADDLALIRKTYLLCKKLGQPDRLADLCRYIKSIVPPQDSPRKILIAEMNYELAEDQEGLDLLGSVPAEDRSPVYYALSINFNIRKGYTAAAVKNCEAAISLDFQHDEHNRVKDFNWHPQLLRICLETATALMEAGQADEAAMAVACALKVSPLDAHALTLLEQTLKSGGRLDDDVKPRSDALPPPASTAEAPSALVLNTLVWGREFVDFFLNYTLPSYLAPNNIPLLCQGKQAEYQIATTRADWKTMQDHPAIAELSKWLRIVPIELPDEEVGSEFAMRYKLLGKYAKVAIDRARELDGGLLFLSADLIASNNALQVLRRAMDAGKRAVMISAISVAKGEIEPRMAPFTTRQDGGIRTIDVAPRDLVRQAMQCRHPLTEWLTWDSDEYADWAFCMYWRLPQATGLVMRWYQLHPVYIYPKNWDAEFTHTVDWDFATNSLDDDDDVYLLADSDDGVFIECSEPKKRSPLPGSAPTSPIDLAWWGREHVGGLNRSFYKNLIWMHDGSPVPKDDWEYRMCRAYGAAIELIDERWGAMHWKTKKGAE